MMYIETQADRDREIVYKENLRAEMLVDAMMNGHRPHHPQGNPDNFYGQEVMEVTQDNAIAVEMDNHKYDESND